MAAIDNVHGHGAVSEVAASEKAARQEGSIRERILEALKDACGHPEWEATAGCLVCGRHLPSGTQLGGPASKRAGLTPEGFAQSTGLLLNTVRRRFTDLWKDGLVKWDGNYRTNLRDNPSKVWVLGEDPERSKAPKRATAARLAELEEENKRLRERVAELELAGTQRSLAVEHPIVRVSPFLKTLRGAVGSSGDDVTRGRPYRHVTVGAVSNKFPENRVVVV
jgi:hypothetical protein